MIGWAGREQLLTKRGPRHAVVGTLRPQEFRVQYADTAAAADETARLWRDQGLYSVRVIPPASWANETELREAGKRWREARDTEREAADAAKAVIRVAAEAGIAETTLAELVGVDRGTIRTALGKPRART